jgi:glucose/arabinose dehydrogenase
MSKKLLIGSGIVLVFIVLIVVSILPTWKAIKPAWVDSPVQVAEIIQKENEDNSLFDVHQDFFLEIIDRDLETPRVMIEDNKGQLLVSEPSLGRVSLIDSTKRITLAESLQRPHGLALQNERLFIAETGQVLEFVYDADKQEAELVRSLLDLPSGGNHWTRTLGIGSDGFLYISVGSSCNICKEADWRRTKILRYNLESQELEVYASGLRNAVFFAWHPVTNDLYATEMGRDWLGDDLPPDELNMIEYQKDYGFPYCYGKNIVDPEFNLVSHCQQAEPSFYDFQAHEAPLGIDFYQNDAIIALHGSWNRSEPVGYEVIRLSEESNYQERESLISGFLQEDGSAIGRPAGVLSHSDGSIYISDDKADLLYRLIPKTK